MRDNNIISIFDVLLTETTASHCINNVFDMCKNISLYPADAYTGRDLSLFATINKQELLLLIKVI